MSALKGGQGLKHLRRVDLERLLKALYKKDFEPPLDAMALHRAGLSYLADKVDFLRPLDANGLRAVLVAVIAERREVEKRQARSEGHPPQRLL